MRIATFAATALAALVLAACSSTSTTSATASSPTMTGEDPYLWLEEVEGDRALTWVREQNARSLHQLESDPRFASLLTDATALANSRDRLPLGGIFEGYYYNFWQDEAHVRGIYRRARACCLRARWRPAMGNRSRHRCYRGGGERQLGVQRHRLPRRHDAVPRLTLRWRQGRNDLSRIRSRHAQLRRTTASSFPKRSPGQLGSTATHSSSPPIGVREP